MQTAHSYHEFHMVMFVYLLAGTLATDVKLLLSLSRVLLKHVNVPALKLAVLLLEASDFCRVSCLMDPIKHVREVKLHTINSDDSIQFMILDS